MPMPRCAFWLPLLTLIYGCGQSFPPKQLNEPCTRTAQCETGLVCSAGVCLPTLDGGADAGS
jgi:hypothetical protein